MPEYIQIAGERGEGRGERREERGSKRGRGKRERGKRGEEVRGEGGRVRKRGRLTHMLRMRLSQVLGGILWYM